MGSLEMENGATASIGPQDGPSLFYQGWGAPDIRTQFSKDNTLPGQQPMTLAILDTFSVDAFPQAASTTALGAAQAVTASLAMTLVTSQVAGTAGAAQIGAGIRIQPSGTTTVVTIPATLDYGYTTGTTVVNSTAVVVFNNQLFTLGQWITIAGAGNAAGTVALYTQVQTISTSNTTGMTIFPVPATSISNVPIGAARLYGANLLPPGSQFGPQQSIATTSAIGIAVGKGRLHGSKEFLARNVSVTVGTTTGTTSFLVVGYDVWKQPMTELIGPVIATNRQVTTFFGSKAFKHIVSVTPTTTAGGNASLGMGDVFGLPYRADDWCQVQIFWNGCTAGTNLGFLPAVTSTATNTTGDVRGTIQVSTNGTGTAMTIATAQVSNGTTRLSIIQNLGPFNQAFATPLNTVPMFGQVNA